MQIQDAIARLYSSRPHFLTYSTFWVEQKQCQHYFIILHVQPCVHMKRSVYKMVFTVKGLYMRNCMYSSILVGFVDCHSLQEYY